LMAQLEGAVTVITGAARGIGRSIALELGRGGACVVANYAHSKEAAEQLVEELRRAGAQDAIAMQADVAMFEEAQRLIQETFQRFGRIDVLVNNAGITADRTMKNLSRDDWDRVIQTDLNANFYTVKAALPVFTEQKSGRIINISSVIGEMGSIGQTNYA